MGLRRMEQKRGLLEKLRDYKKSDYYPYHMPGHKRRQLGKLPEDLLGLDITEIDGFDNLHQAEGILQRLQDEANELYQAEETFYLINGSTGGILSAVSTVLPEGGHLLMARNSHKSVYHAAYLRKLRITYLYPARVQGFDFYEAVTAEQVEQALNQEPDIGAVLIVSPTYEGRIADVREIAQVVHKKGIPLIVDEAHGAHLGFAKGFSPGSCTEGADLVIHSVHKTLPALTQTALLHVNGSLVDRERLRRFLHIYQTSSPSYLLMASIEDALKIAGQERERFDRFLIWYQQMLTHLQGCRVLRFVPWQDVEQGRQDIGKLVIVTDKAGVSGQWLYDELREKYHLQCEMSAGTYCLAMFTLADDKEAYTRMVRALIQIDSELAEKLPLLPEMDTRPERIFSTPNIAYSLAEAWDMPCKMTRLSDAINCPVAEFINLYPPGIPLLVPGEVMTEELYGEIVEDRMQGLNIQGIVEQEGNCFVKKIITGD
ncbi:MAG: aminotransferase class I/II-fold pyridoxal phosphate-dependent enzyme [Acetatifactor sp.]|nr:aminotransferase class I/II-fold pyridoxal phosphate-dependent enzyme [Acetatifactor sp.]